MTSEEMVMEAWTALTSGDLASVEEVLAPDASWRAVRDGPWNCESRRQIMDVLGSQLQRGLSGRIEEITDVGARAVVGFRPADHSPSAWPLDEGVRYIVLSFRDGVITEMKGCETRVAAFEYARGD